MLIVVALSGSISSMFASKVALREGTESMILDNRSRLITASLQLAIEAPSPILISVGSVETIVGGSA
jgi:hypothetical protein